MNEAARAVAERLGLAPHPEGGFFRETYRDAHSTAIYFLLPHGTFSAWHRIDGAEAWHHYAGGRLALHMIDAGGAHRRVVLGEPDGEAVPQAFVAPGAWQAAEPLDGEYTLVGCTVAPPFSFDRFELGERDELARAFPQHAELVARLTR